jgi:hypothetical protein
MMVTPTIHRNRIRNRERTNTAGIERQATLLVQPADTFDRLPAARDAARSFRPAPYRYSVLVERAKNLVNIAQQVEQNSLVALGKRDAEVYNLLKAKGRLQLASARRSTCKRCGSGKRVKESTWPRDSWTAPPVSHHAQSAMGE